MSQPENDSRTHRARPERPQPRGTRSRRSGRDLARTSKNADGGTHAAADHTPDLHVHAHGHGPAPRSSRRVRVILASFLIPALLLTVVGMVLLWPHGAPERGTIDTTADTAGKLYGVVTGEPEGNLVPVTLDDTGEQVQVMFPPDYLALGVDVGSTLKILHIPQAAASGSEYVFMDYTRDLPIGLLAAAYLVVVIAVAGWRGLASIAGLLISFGVVVFFTLPALLVGTNPIGVALVTSSVVMFIVLYLAHGFTARTSAAMLGTMIGLVITAALAGWAVDAANIFGLSDEYALALPAYAPDVDIRGIAVCGIVLAGLGVLNDVTITQASSVWELRAASPTMNRREPLRPRHADRPRPHRLDRLHDRLRLPRRGPADAAHGLPHRHEPRRDADVRRDRPRGGPHPRRLDRPRPRDPDHYGHRRSRRRQPRIPRPAPRHDTRRGGAGRQCTRRCAPRGREARPP